MLVMHVYHTYIHHAYTMLYLELYAGNMASAYSYTLVLVEVADTVKQPDLTKASKDGKQPESESQVMKKASRIAITLTVCPFTQNS